MRGFVIYAVVMVCVLLAAGAVAEDFPERTATVPCYAADASGIMVNNCAKYTCCTATGILQAGSGARQGMDAVLDQLRAWNVEMVVCYSFPRHMGQEAIAGRVAALRAACASGGIDWMERAAPDTSSPNLDAQALSTFIRDDIMEWIVAHPDTNIALYTPAEGLMDSMRTCAGAGGAVYLLLPCCPVT